MYKLLFIDEEKEALDTFKDYVEDSEKKKLVEVETGFPLETLEEMIIEILNKNPDAIITDFRLNEMRTDIDYNVNYNGAELVEALLKIRTGFPCFVLTSFDESAINQSDDVNVVYVKDVLNESTKDINSRSKFLERVIKQIDHYKAKIQNAEKDLTELIELRQRGEATMKQEEKIIELDNFLEKATDNRNSIPEDFKSLSNEDKLRELLNKSEAILKKLKHEQ